MSTSKMIPTTPSVEKINYLPRSMEMGNSEGSKQDFTSIAENEQQLIFVDCIKMKMPIVTNSGQVHIETVLVPIHRRASKIPEETGLKGQQGMNQIILVVPPDMGETTISQRKRPHTCLLKELQDDVVPEKSDRKKCSADMKEPCHQDMQDVDKCYVSSIPYDSEEDSLSTDSSSSGVSSMNHDYTSSEEFYLSSSSSEVSSMNHDYTSSEEYLSSTDSSKEEESADYNSQRAPINECISRTLEREGIPPTHANHQALPSSSGITYNSRDILE